MRHKGAKERRRKAVAEIPAVWDRDLAAMRNDGLRILIFVQRPGLLNDADSSAPDRIEAGRSAAEQGLAGKRDDPSPGAGGDPTLEMSLHRCGIPHGRGGRT